MRPNNYICPLKKAKGTILIHQACDEPFVVSLKLYGVSEFEAVWSHLLLFLFKMMENAPRVVSLHHNALLIQEWGEKRKPL